ncbi:hypothetical protein KI387_009657, partial [Taxus chinensis]
FTRFRSFTEAGGAVWTDFYFLEPNGSIYMTNAYRPYQYRLTYWDEFFVTEAVNKDNVIIGGNLNFTLSQRELLAANFIHKLVAAKLCDVESLKLAPTWRNNRLGDEFEEQNGLFKEALPKKEEKEVIHSFQKDKSPYPNGWHVEFYLSFCELLEEDLLGVEEESRTSGFCELLEEDLLNVVEESRTYGTVLGAELALSSIKLQPGKGKLVWSSNPLD